MNGPPISILLVDDDPKNLLALEAVLESPEHHLVKAQTADAALLALMRDDYAAIVLDVQMPDLNGIELARLIKQRKRTQHIPILFLTAHYRENEHAVLGYDVGAVDYLTKPVHPAVLRSKVSVFVDLFRKTRALAEMNRNLEAEIIERKTAEERFRVVVEAAPSAMVLFTEEGAIVLVNSEAELLFGRPRAELLASRIQELLPAGELPDFMEIVEHGDFHSDPASPRAITVYQPNGSEIPTEASFTPIQSTEGVRLLASILNVAERMQAEAALRSANAELEAKNVALQRQARERLRRIRAEAAQAEAEAANAAKDRFLAMLSHELRTPLSAVLHGVTLIEEPNDCPAELRETLQLIRRNVQLEARLIDDLLDLARIRNGKLQLQLQAADAHELLRLALDICRRDIAARGLKVEMALGASSAILQADPARLQQIFWNLISNAVKFTPAGGRISIGTREQNGHLEVEITDNGVGIEPEKLARIFDAFEQASHRDRAGLGLGLAICKALTEFHGGEIFASSGGLGEGSTFTILLPLAGEQSAIEPPVIPPAITINAVPLRLMLVEDHHDTAATLLRLLARRGYQVMSAGSVSGAVELAKTFDFDVLVSDIGLPDGTGIELLRRLREQPGREQLCGIALSGFGMDEDIARSKEAGFSKHLTKPVDFAQLQLCLSAIGQQLRSGEPARVNGEHSGK
ncbi:MAG TPA: response regulator [Candidatus Kapabacteria bacterium]|nr:response regulator [Candidatus Kapabacteria bacterium]